MKILSSQGDEAYSPLFNCGLCIVNFLPKSTVCKGWKKGNSQWQNLANTSARWSSLMGRIWEPSLLPLQLLHNSKTALNFKFIKKKTMQNKTKQCTWTVLLGNSFLVALHVLEDKAKQHENYPGLTIKIFSRTLKIVTCGIST